MFTGIVQAVGRIVRLKPFEVDAGKLGLSGVKRGDSICVQGACLTVVGRKGRTLRFDVSQATLKVTAGLDAPGPVNLEKSLRIGDTLGGHLVAGHVDGVGKVAGRKAGVVQVRVPRGLARFIARKGSICVDGVSLTVNRVRDREFEANLVPHTLKMTTLRRLQPGTKVNLEIDLLARLVQRPRAGG